MDMESLRVFYTCPDNTLVTVLPGLSMGTNSGEIGSIPVEIDDSVSSDDPESNQLFGD